MTTETEQKLKILVVEDEAIVALDLKFILEDLGYAIIGPHPSLAAGIKAVETGPTPDIAVLDVRLPDGDVFPLADRLAEGGVKLLFHSGHVRSGELTASYPAAVFCPKPATPSRLQAALSEIVAPDGDEAVQHQQG